jgi:thiamine transport system permease protein
VDVDRAAVTPPQPARGGARLGARVWRFATVAIPAAFLLVFFAYPVLAILGRGLVPRGSIDLDPVGRVLTDAGLRGVLWFSVWEAALSTLLTLAIGIPGAWALSRFAFPGRRAARAFVTVPFVLPTVVVGAAFTTIFGTDGSLVAILLAHAFFNTAVVVRTVGGLWSQLDGRSEDAARALGASPARAFLHVTLPALRPAIVAAGAIVFLFCFTSFGIVLILGGPTRATLEVEIYRQTADQLQLGVAAALAVVQLLAVTAMLLVAGKLQGHRAVALALRPADAVARHARNVKERIGLGVVLVGVLGFLAWPMAILVDRSFGSDHGFTLDAYRSLDRTGPGSALFVPPVHAIATSLRYALGAVLISVVIGGLASLAALRRDGHAGRVLDGALMIPLGTSAVTLGFGFLIALDRPPVDLRTSPWLVPIAQALVAIPFVVRTVVPLGRAVDPRLRDAAAVLGAAPARVWRAVDLPVLGPALALGAGFAAAISLGEFGATALIARPDNPTLPIAIFRLLGVPGAQNYHAAMALTTILMALTLVVVFAVEAVPGRFVTRATRGTRG